MEKIIHRDLSGKRTLDDLIAVPYHDQGLSSIFTRVRRAPLYPPHDFERTLQGFPIFLYKPSKNLTGSDDTRTVYGLQDINYGLYQKALYERARLLDADVPEELSRYSEWPMRPEEVFGKIVPYGALGSSPVDYRFEAKTNSVPVQQAGYAHNIPWLWDNVFKGSEIGWIFKRIKDYHPISNPTGMDAIYSDVYGDVGVDCLQCLPYSGPPLHGEAGTRESVDGLVRGIGGFEVREFGRYFRFGRVTGTNGTQPSGHKIDRAVYTYDGMTSMQRTFCRLTVVLNPNPAIIDP